MQFQKVETAKKKKRHGRCQELQSSNSPNEAAAFASKKAGVVSRKIRGLLKLRHRGEREYTSYLPLRLLRLRVFEQSYAAPEIIL
jgi:hypothetical protein